jgi:hypothetical protein
MTDETNSSGLHAGDKLQTSSGAQFQVTRIEGPFIFLREVLNGDLVGPELQKTAGDLIYLGAPEKLSSLAIAEKHDVCVSVQEKDNSLHEPPNLDLNRMFIRKEELEGVEQDEQWTEKVLEDAEKDFREMELGTIDMLNPPGPKMRVAGAEFEKDIAYLRKQIFAGLGIPEATLVGQPASDMAQLTFDEDAAWLEQALRKVLSEKMLMRVDRLLRQHTLIKEALQRHRELVYQTEYLGMWMEKPEPGQAEERIKYAPGKTPVSAVLGITDRPNKNGDHKIGFMATERNGVPVLWPNGEGKARVIREGEQLKEGDDVWVPDLCGRGYIPMKIVYGSQGLTAKGERLTAALRYEDGELLCSCLMNLDAVKKLKLKKEEDDG